MADWFEKYKDNTKPVEEDWFSKYQDKTVPVDEHQSFRGAGATGLWFGNKTFGEAIAEKPLSKIPFIGGVAAAQDIADVVLAANRLKINQYEPAVQPKGILEATGFEPLKLTSPEQQRGEDIYTVTKYLLDVNRQYTSGGTIGNIISNMPAFMIDFLITGGLAEIGDETARKTGIKILKDYAETKAGKAAIATGAFATSAAFRSAGMPQRATAAIIKRQAPEAINIKDDGAVEIKGPGEGWFTSVWKGLLDHYFEVASEQAGEQFRPLGVKAGKMLKKAPLFGKIYGALETKWLSLHPNKSAWEFAKKVSNKAGFHGILSEVGEEYLGDMARAIFNVNDFGTGPDSTPIQRLSAAVIQETQNLPEMLVAFAVPGTGQFLLARKLGVKFDDAEKLNPYSVNQSPTTDASPLKVEKPGDIIEVIRDQSQPQYDPLSGVEVGSEVDVDNVIQGQIAEIAEGLISDGMDVDKAWEWARKEYEEELGNNTETKKSLPKTPTSQIRERLLFIQRANNPVYPTTVQEEAEKLVNETGMSLEEATELLYKLREPLINATTSVEEVQDNVKAAIDQANSSKVNLPTEELIGERRGWISSLLRKTKERLISYHQGMVIIRNLFREMDGQEHGTLYNLIWKPMRLATVQSTLKRAMKISEVKDFLRANDIGMRWLYNSRVRVPGMKAKLAPVDRVEVYLASFDADKKRHLIEGNGITEGQMRAIVGSLTPQERKLGDFLRSQYENYYDDIAPIYEAVTGKRLPKLPGYSRIFIKRKGFLNIKQDYDQMIEDELEGRGLYMQKGIEKGFTQERTKYADQPLELDALGNFLEHLRQVEHYKAMAIAGKNVGAILNNRDFQKTVDARTHGAGTSLMQKWLRDIVSESTTLETTYWSKLFGVLRRNAVTSALGLNILTALKQPLSLSIAMAENPKMLFYVTKGMIENSVPGYHAQLRSFVEGKSNLVRTRNIERELRVKARLQDAKSVFGKTPTLSDVALAGVKFFDQNTVRVVWKAAYEMSINNGMNEKEAVEYADGVIEKTQPMGDILDLPAFFRGGIFEKMFSTFQNQINKNYNYWVYDILGEVKGKRISTQLAAYRVMMSYIFPAMLLGLVSRGRLPKGWKEAAVDLASYGVVPLFFFGQMVSSLLQGFEPRLGVGLGAFEDAAKALKTKGWGKKVQYGVAAGSQLAGLPYNQPRRTVQGIVDMAQGETSDPRRLIWSAYTINPPNQKKTGVGETRTTGRSRTRKHTR